MKTRSARARSNTPDTLSTGTDDATTSDVSVADGDGELACEHRCLPRPDGPLCGPSLERLFVTFVTVVLDPVIAARPLE